ncbi:BC1881 family protein [Paraclostridium bifermentans]|nr:BC1881 family protein [Paraclostridium bifermentans]
MNDLKNIATKELVEELKNREGIEIKEVDPYKDEVINVNGPCVVITVVD